MKLIVALTASCIAALAAWPASAQQADPGRGELLYTTHCIACHSTQMHWRDGRKAKDWETLKAQVRIWQGNAALGWSEDDIVAVAGHLNRTIYRYPRTGDRVSLAPAR
jgi:mono/diheme cytochrome c family protein